MLEITLIYEVVHIYDLYLFMLAVNVKLHLNFNSASLLFSTFLHSVHNRWKMSNLCALTDNLLNYFRSWSVYFWKRVTFAIEVVSTISVWCEGGYNSKIFALR